MNKGYTEHDFLRSAISLALGGSADDSVDAVDIVNDDVNTVVDLEDNVDVCGLVICTLTVVPSHDPSSLHRG
jgi:hypothetical protein